MHFLGLTRADSNVFKTMHTFQILEGRPMSVSNFNVESNDFMSEIAIDFLYPKIAYF